MTSKEVEVDLSNISGELSRKLENKFRELFVVNRNSELLDDPYVTLIPVYDKYDSYKLNLDNNDSKNLLKSGSTYIKDSNLKTGDSSVVTQIDFIDNFNLFTEHQLSDLNWDNLFVAGGAVLASMLHVPESHSQDPMSKRNYYHIFKYPEADIDIFIYGLDQEAATKKLVEVYESLIKKIPYKTNCFRTPNAITIVSQCPYRHIQIVLRLYKSPAEILMCFDVDSCSVGFDGSQVWTTPRARDSLIKMTNTVDISRRSPSYEYRLWKYSNRGFSTELPNLQEDQIDPQIYLKKAYKINGLAKLFLLMSNKSEDNRNVFNHTVRTIKLRPRKKENVALINKLNSATKNKLDMFDVSKDTSDYSTLYLPWGQDGFTGKMWKSEKIARLMKMKNSVLNSHDYDPNRKYPTHICFIGDMSQVILDCAVKDEFSIDSVPNEELKEFKERYVYGNLKWKVLNPGEQKIGSFHPIDDDGWEKDAYVDSKVTELHETICKKDTSRLIDLINSNVDINRKDFAGRTALHLAVLFNNSDALVLLLEAGAKLSYKLEDGRSAFHLACESGYTELAELILNYGKVLKERNSQLELTQDITHDSHFSTLKDITEFHKKAKQNKLKNEDQENNLDSELEETDKFDINDTDWDISLSPLFTSILLNKLDIFKVLVSQPDINMNAKWKIYDEWNSPYCSYSILELCVKLNRQDFIGHLISLKFDLTELNKGEYILNSVVKEDNFELVKLFVDNGHLVNCFSKLNYNSIYTPLTTAIEQYLKLANNKDSNTNSMENIIVYLLNKGANTYYDIKDVPSRTELMSMGASPNSETFYNSIKQPYNLVIKSSSYWLIDLIIKFDKNLINFVFYNQHNEIKYTTPLDEVNSMITIVNNNLEDTKLNLDKSKSAILIKKSSKSFIDDELDYENIRTTSRLKDVTSIEADIKMIKDSLYNLEKIKTLLEKKGAKNVNDIPYYKNKKNKNLNDSDNSDELEGCESVMKATARKTKKSINISSPVVNYYAINHKKDTYYTTNTYSCHKFDKTSKYTEFFEAVNTGDTTKIVSLTNSSDPVHVCSFSSISKRTPLHIAAQKDDVAMFVMLMDTALKQYTPMIYNKKSIVKHIPTINNAYLNSIIKDNNYNEDSDSDGIDDNSISSKYDDKESSKLPEHIVSLVDPNTLLSMNIEDIENDKIITCNLIKTIINHKSAKCYNALFDYSNLFKIDKVISLLIQGYFHYKFVRDSSINYLSRMLKHTTKFEDTDREGLLVHAVEHARAESVLFLVKYAKNYKCFSDLNKFKINCKDSNNNSLLHLICRFNIKEDSNFDNYLKCVRLITTMDPSQINSVNNDGDTPLHLCANNSSKDIYKIFQMLLELGVDPTLSNKQGNKPVHNIVAHGRINMLDILLRFDETQLNILTDIYNSTPLIVALKSKNYDMSEHIIMRGANTTLYDIYGNFPVHYACTNGYHKLLNKLSYNRSTENKFGVTSTETAYQRMRQIFNYKMSLGEYKCTVDIEDVKEQDKCLKGLGWCEDRVRTDLKSCNEVYKFIQDKII